MSLEGQRPEWLTFDCYGTLIQWDEGLVAAVKRILDKLGCGRFVFNLGHGIVPQTPPENVARLIELVRGR